MKKKVEKMIALVMCAVMLIGIAPLSGFVGIDLPDFAKLFANEASAASSGTCGDNLTWEYVQSTQALYINGTGAMMNCYSTSDVPWDYYKSSIKTVEIASGVTSISDWTFWNCSSLTSVTIPDSVTSIGLNAFSECTGLTSITIPDSVTSIGYDAFEKCTGLTNITIPDSVTSIGDYAFWGCTGLTSITIPDSVTSIGDGVFYNTGYYNREVNWTDNVLYIGNHLIEAKPEITGNYSIKANTKTVADDAFSGCTDLTSVTIPDSVISIGDYAFYNCDGLTSITIPDSVTSIGGAFSGCTGLTSITVDSGNTVYHSEGNCLIETGSKTLIEGCKNSVIPDDGSVTSIGDRAFEYCTGLTSITIPNSVTSIGFVAFFMCTELTSITIPNSVTSIGDYAFWGCTGLTSITIPDSVTSIGDGVFYYCDALSYITVSDSNPVYHSAGNCMIETDNKTLILGCKNSFIPDDGSVISICDAFIGCTGLTSITIPDGVTSIGDNAFRECTGLTSITILDSVTSIGECAFGYCIGLTEITIPDSVTSIGEAAFYLCEKLSDVYFIGSEEEWNEIEIGEENECLINATIHFNYDAATATDAEPLPCYTTPDGLTYVIFDGHAEVVDCNQNVSGLLIIPSSVTFDGVEYPVTGIGNNAFEDCTGLTSITIPDSVTSIGVLPFSGCQGLTSIEVSENNPIYHSADNCLIETESKTLILGCQNSVIPSNGSVTVIGDGAFYNCTGLQSIVIPDSVTGIGRYSFYCCYQLTDVTIGDGVTSIGEDAFATCYHLKNLSIGNSIETIGDWAFASNSALKSITIPDSVTHIGEMAFLYCFGLKTITIGSSVETIGAGAFILSMSPEYRARAQHAYEEMLVEGMETFDGFPISEMLQLLENAQSSLTDIYINKNRSDWDSVDVKTGYEEFGPDALQTATLHFLDDEPSHDHSYTSALTVTPTCTTDGEITYTCECGDSYTEVIPAAGHKPASPVKENIVPATFTDDGSYDEVVYCSVCSQELSRKTVVIPKIVFISGEIDKTAVVRGNQGVWTIKTTDVVEWLKFNVTYTTSSGNTYNSSVYFKATNYMNAAQGVTVSDNNGERIWTIPMTFNFSGTDDTVLQTWTVTYKVKNSSLWVDSPYSQEITVGKTEQSIAPKPEEYAPYSLVRANCDFTEIGKGARGDITIVTTSDCTKVRVTYTDAATGKVKASTFQTTSKSNVSFTDNATTGLRTWTIGFKFAAAAQNNEFRVDTRGVEWTESKSVNVEVK